MRWWHSFLCSREHVALVRRSKSTLTPPRPRQSRQLSAGDSPEIGTTDVHIDTMSMKAFYKRALTLLFRATWEAAAEVPVSAVYSCPHVAGCLDGRGSLW